MKKQTKVLAFVCFLLRVILMKCIPKHFHSFMRICIVDIAVKATIKIFSRSRNHMLQHVRYPFVDVPVIVNYVLIFICSKAKMVRAVFYIRRTISFSTNNDDLINVCFSSLYFLIQSYESIIRERSNGFTVTSYTL